jgi:hypothetical protein
MGRWSHQHQDPGMKYSVVCTVFFQNRGSPVLPGHDREFPLFVSRWLQPCRWHRLNASVIPLSRVSSDEKIKTSVMVATAWRGVRTLELIKVAPVRHHRVWHRAHRTTTASCSAPFSPVNRRWIVLNHMGLVLEWLTSRCTGKKKSIRWTASNALFRTTALKRRMADRLVMCTGSNLHPAPAGGLQGVVPYIADTNAMIDAARGTNTPWSWRPAEPGSGQRPDAAQHDRQRGPRQFPTLMERQAGQCGPTSCCKVLEGRRPEVF